MASPAHFGAASAFWVLRGREHLILCDDTVPDAKKY